MAVDSGDWQRILTSILPDLVFQNDKICPINTPHGALLKIAPNSIDQVLPLNRISSEVVRLARH